MSQRTAIRRKIRFAVAAIGIWVLLLGVTLGLMLLVKGIPRQFVWGEQGFVAGPVLWGPQDTVIVAVLIVLQSFLLGLFKIVRVYRARLKSPSME